MLLFFVQISTSLFIALISPSFTFLPLNTVCIFPLFFSRSSFPGRLCSPNSFLIRTHSHFPPLTHVFTRLIRIMPRWGFFLSRVAGDYFAFFLNYTLSALFISHYIVFLYALILQIFIFFFRNFISSNRGVYC